METDLAFELSEIQHNEERRQTQQRASKLDDTANQHRYEGMQTTEGKYVLSKQQLGPLQGHL